ncbi:Transposable element Tc1 transposase [Folsomia candida]|uniref:Transposable element Tc1 transposase n=1 Tax=Folsomia candida TaxID=158441 RepID=A0A226DNV8_FOLCA|nr:Transposable element Tc1 transposase [Folsomia candida]
MSSAKGQITFHESDPVSMKSVKELFFLCGMCLMIAIDVVPYRKRWLSWECGTAGSGSRSKGKEGDYCATADQCLDPPQMAGQPKLYKHCAVQDLFDFKFEYGFCLYSTDSKTRVDFLYVGKEKYDGVDTQGNSYRYSRSCHSGLEGWTKRGLSQRQIWTKYKLARTTIQTIIKNFKANGSVQNKVRSGRKPILAHREVRHVLNKVNVTPSLSAPKLSTEIKEMFGKQSSPEASYCTEECNQTSEVCQRPHFQATNILGHILWTDESKFNVFGSDGRRRVWRYPKEALNPKNLNPTVKHGGGSVMVWGCMASRICSKTWTWTTICLPTRQRSETLCQVHHGILQEKKIPKLEWPPQSPDLNPIEHLCDHIEREIRKQSFSGIPGLKSRIREVWETISEDVTKNLVNSMTRRLEAVLKANGGPTKY